MSKSLVHLFRKLPSCICIEHLNHFVRCDTFCAYAFYIGPDKELFFYFLALNRSYFLTYVLGAQKNRRTETVLLNTHNTCQFG